RPPISFLMIRRPPRSTQGVSSAASDVYKRQVFMFLLKESKIMNNFVFNLYAVSYTHLRAHETLSDLVCRLLLEKMYFIHISEPTRLAL
ncbi:hypothetical protein, partial [Staphylococcus aureus]